MQSLQPMVKTSKKLKRDSQQEPTAEPKSVLETTAEPKSVLEPTAEPSLDPAQEIRLVDIPINNENTALNVMVGFLNVAHKRGSFTIDESAKIWECISKFQKM